MRRREFIGLLGGAVAWPCTAQAQQGERMPTIGFLGAGTASSQRQWTAAFVQRLRELGWIEGQTVAIEYRWAEGSSERAAAAGTEFVGRKVDVILTNGTAVTIAVKRTTSAIPIVFAAAGARSVPAWSQIWRDRTATSPAFQSRRPISLGSISN